MIMKNGNTTMWNLALFLYERSQYRTVLFDMFSQKTDKAVDTGKYFFLLNLPIQLRTRKFVVTILTQYRIVLFDMFSQKTEKAIMSIILVLV